MYKLLTLDLDGTTLDSQKKIPPETIEALKKLRSMKVEAAIASGRGVAELIDYREMTDEIRFAILLSGALVYNCQELKPVAYRAIDPKLQREIIQAGIDENAMVQLLTTGNRSAGRLILIIWMILRWGFIIRCMKEFASVARIFSMWLTNIRMKFAKSTFIIGR